MAAILHEYVDIGPSRFECGHSVKSKLLAIICGGLATDSVILVFDNDNDGKIQQV